MVAAKKRPKKNRDWETLFPDEYIRAECEKIRAEWDDKKEAERAGREAPEYYTGFSRIILPNDI